MSIRPLPQQHAPVLHMKNQHAPVLRTKSRHAPVPRAMGGAPPCCAM